MPKANAYLKLKKLFEEVSAFDSAMSILRWDAETYMQAGSRESRALELATLSHYKKKILIDTSTSHLLNKALEEDLGFDDRLNLLEMESIVLNSKIIPEKLNQSLIHAISTCEATWLEARETNNYKLFLPSFKTMLNLTRDKAQIRADNFKLSLYDALIHEHDKHLHETDLDPICSKLETDLPKLIQTKSSNTSLQGKVDAIQCNEFKASARNQKRFTKKLLKKLEFNYKYGRFDETLHPFCEGHSEDIRVAVNFDENNYLHTIMAVMHEFGHALYDTRLPKAWQRQPLGKDAGMIVHESQALLFEMMIARSESFFELILPLMQEILGANPKIKAQQFSQELRKTNPGLIRIKADFLSYPAHIIIRYKLEQQLIYGDLSPEDLPEAFNYYYDKILGLKAKTLKEGVLQDIHWAAGYFGYFPCYLIGAIISALLFAKLQQEFSNLSEMIRTAQFNPIYKFLETEIYQHGRKINSISLLTSLLEPKARAEDEYLKILEQY
jgi:carboxypeptidase Taq